MDQPGMASAGYLVMPQAAYMASAGKPVHLIAQWPHQSFQSAVGAHRMHSNASVSCKPSLRHADTL